MILESDHRPKRMGEPMSTVVCSPISHRKLDRLITRRHDARVSFARTLGVEQSELISRLDTFATKKGKHDRTR